LERVNLQRPLTLRVAPAWDIANWPNVSAIWASAVVSSDRSN